MFATGRAEYDQFYSHGRLVTTKMALEIRPEVSSVRPDFERKKLGKFDNPSLAGKQLKILRACCKIHSA